jgi:uncharacterized protein
LQLTRETSNANVIRAWNPGRVRIGEEWFSGHMIVSAEQIITNWRIEAPGDIGLGDLGPALELEPEIILLGTGEERVLPDMRLMAMLAERAIGLETMDTRAACRTFNVLLHEHRRVVAALFNPVPPG